MKAPSITVGIASYNSFNSIEKAINSALYQSLLPIEIIIVDDCSSDKTGKLIKISSNNKKIRAKNEKIMELVLLEM